MFEALEQANMQQFDQNEIKLFWGKLNQTFTLYLNKRTIIGPVKKKLKPIDVNTYLVR